MTVTGPQPAGAGEERPGASPRPSGRGVKLMVPLQRFTAEAERYVQLTRAWSGLSHRDLRAISEVREAERDGRSLGLGDLARRLVLSASATTAVVQRLGRRGHLVRVDDPRDRRGGRVQLTPAARRTGRMLFQPMAEELAAEFAAWDEQELEVFRRRIPELTRALVRAQQRLDGMPELGEGTEPSA